MSWIRAHPALWRALLVLYYLAVLVGLDRDVRPWRLFHAAICLSGILSESHRTNRSLGPQGPERDRTHQRRQTLTYGELRRRSDALAAHLTKRFGDDRAPIAVLGHREPEMLIAFLGAVKSGRPVCADGHGFASATHRSDSGNFAPALPLTPKTSQNFPVRAAPLRSVCKATTHFTFCSPAAAPANRKA